MENTTSIQLAAHELEFLAWFLEDASADFQDHSADETFLEANAGTLAIAKEIRKKYGTDAPRPQAFRMRHEDAKMVQFYTSQAMQFFADRCRMLAASEDERLLSRAEIELLAELMDLAAEDHERVADEVCFDLTLDLTPENRNLFGMAADAGLARGVRRETDEATAAAVHAAVRDAQAETIDIPDYWVMAALSRRCRELAARG
jgi:hypothetical protein